MEERLPAVVTEGYQALLVALAMEDREPLGFQVEVGEFQPHQLADADAGIEKGEDHGTVPGPMGVSASQQASSLRTPSGEKGWTIFCGRRTFLMWSKGDWSR